MPLAHMSHISVFIAGPLVIVGLASAWMAQKTLDKWTRDTVRIPMVQRGRGSWGAYMRAHRNEMPASVRKQISLYSWIGGVAWTLLALVLCFCSLLM